MDQVLKARKLSSASARKKRISEIQEAEHRLEELYMDHRRRILYDEIIENDSDSDTEPVVERPGHERDDSVETPSECSVVTPKDSPPQILFEKVLTEDIPTKRNTVILSPQTSFDPEPKKTMPPSPQPKLQASLATPADFCYDRFSIVMSSPDMNASIASVEPEEKEAPLQTATPIAISAKRVRPSLISISSRASSTKRKSETIQSPLSHVESRSDSKPESRAASPPLPPVPPRNARRLSQMSTLSVMSSKSGFAAGEATRFEVPNVPDLPANAISKIANASVSRTSLTLDTLMDQPKPVSKKNSMPLLSSAINKSHSRMSSLKNMMKSPSSHPRTPSEPLQGFETRSARSDSRNSRPPTSAADILNDSFKAFETVPADLHEPPRPRTSYATTSRPSMQHRNISSISQHSIGAHSVTALPSFPPPSEELRNPPAEACPAPYVGQRDMKRKKSFQTLRKRSESIGQAIKFAAFKTKPSSTQHDVPLPPPPPRPSQSQSGPKSTSVSMSGADLRSNPMPPFVPKSPAPSIKSSRKNTSSYSPFPPSPVIASDKGMVGLGLRVR